MSAPEPEDEGYVDWLKEMNLYCEEADAPPGEPWKARHDYYLEVFWDGSREHRVLRCSRCGLGEWGEVDPVEEILGEGP